MFTAEVRRGFVPILARPPPIGNMMKVKRAEGSAPPRGAGHSARRLMVENQEIQMGKRTKQERQRDAQLEATKRVGKQMLTLSVALLRVDALSEALSPVATRLAERPETQEQLGEEAFEATERLENSDLTRADGLLSLVFAARHAVVEEWREWTFSDAEVDRLLTSPHTKLLEKHRHAVFHADHYDD